MNLCCIRYVAAAQIELAISSGALPLVVRMLSTESDSQMAPALRVLGNVATGSDQLTDVSESAVS